MFSRHKVLHRDIKPSNFLYSRERGEFCLVDLGLAQLQGQYHSIDDVINQTLLLEERIRLKQNQRLQKVGTENEKIEQQNSTRNECNQNGRMDENETQIQKKQISRNINSNNSSNTNLPSVIKVFNVLRADGSPLSAYDPLYNKELSSVTEPSNRTVNRNTISSASRITHHSSHFSTNSTAALLPFTKPSGTHPLATPNNLAVPLLHHPSNRNQPRRTLSHSLYQLQHQLQQQKNNQNQNHRHQQQLHTQVSTKTTSQTVIPPVPRWGTRGFRAPEILIRSRIPQTSAIDVWSAGIILLTILSHRYPLLQSGDDTEALGEILRLWGRTEFSVADRAVILENCAVLNGGLRTLLRWCCPWFSWPEILLDLMEKTLELDPRRRITAREALAHPFFATDMTKYDHRVLKGIELYQLHELKRREREKADKEKIEKEKIEKEKDGKEKTNIPNEIKE